MRPFPGRPGTRPRLTEADKAIRPEEVTAIVRFAEGYARRFDQERVGPQAWAARRDYLLVRVLAETGLRASEAARLELGDLWLLANPPYLVVRKGKRRELGDRDSVFLSSALAAELELYRRRYVVPAIEQRRAGSFRFEELPGWRLFSTSEGRPITGRHVLAAVKRAVLELGLNPRFSAHTLRHAYGTALARSPGATPLGVAKAMRLRDVNVVLRYFHPTGEELSRLAEAARVR